MCIRERNFASMNLFNRREMIMLSPIEVQVMHVPICNFMGQLMGITSIVKLGIIECISSALRPEVVRDEDGSALFEVPTGRYKADELRAMLNNMAFLERSARRISQELMAIVATFAHIYGLDDLEVMRMAALYVQDMADDGTLSMTMSNTDNYAPLGISMSVTGTDQVQAEAGDRARAMQDEADDTGRTWRRQWPMHWRA